MSRTAAVLSIVAALAAGLLPPAGSAAEAKLTAAQIADRAVAARGGLQRWQAVRTMTWSGTMQAGGTDRPAFAVRGESQATVSAAMPALKEQPELPFVLDFARPSKSRLELQFKGETAIQVYDGQQGWKYRPYLNRRVVEPYTADELKLAAAQPELDGPLIDYAKKGTSLALEGTELLDGHNTYKLKLTFKDRQVRRVWIDAQTFLETRVEGAPRRLDGKEHSVFTYMSDYREEGGLMLPHLLETRVAGVQRTEKIHITAVKLNPSLADALFAKPQMLAAAK